MDYETGATSQQANNLVLSVLNDGAVYQDRIHCVWAALSGGSHWTTIKELVANEARKQRAQGCTFKPAHISEAAKIVYRQTLSHCLETIRDSYTGGRVHVIGRLWWDRGAGNTYLSASIVIPTTSGERIVNVPFQYGYGEQWKFEALATLRAIGIPFDTAKEPWEQPIDYTALGYGLKRNMFEGVTL